MTCVRLTVIDLFDLSKGARRKGIEQQRKEKYCDSRSDHLDALATRGAQIVGAHKLAHKDRASGADASGIKQPHSRCGCLITYKIAYNSLSAEIISFFLILDFLSNLFMFAL